MAKSVVLEAKNVKKTFHLGKEDLEVLKGINIEIYSGEYVIFFGPSGCGKSTLLNVLSGLEPPTEGKLLVRGESLYKKSQKEITDYRRSKIGIVFQQFNLLKALTIQENIALPLAAGGQNYKKRMDRAAHLLEMVGLKKYKDHKPSELSGGQQQRVAIGRALSTNPWILICDEPTGNLDSKSADEIMNIIEGLNSKSRRTVLLVTHNPDYLQFPHRVFYLKDGEIIKTQVNRDITKEDANHHEFSDKNIDYKAAFENIGKAKETKTQDAAPLDLPAKDHELGHNELKSSVSQSVTHDSVSPTVGSAVNSPADIEKAEIYEDKPVKDDLVTEINDELDHPYEHHPGHFREKTVKIEEGKQYNEEAQVEIKEEDIQPKKDPVVINNKSDGSEGCDTPDLLEIEQPKQDFFMQETSLSEERPTERGIMELIDHYKH